MSKELAQISRYVQEAIPEIEFHLNFFQTFGDFLARFTLANTFSPFSSKSPLQYNWNICQTHAKFSIFARFAIFVTFAIYVNKATTQGTPLEIYFKFSPTLWRSLLDSHFVYFWIYIYIYIYIYISGVPSAQKQD